MFLYESVFIDGVSYLYKFCCVILLMLLLILFFIVIVILISVF